MDRVLRLEFSLLLHALLFSSIMDVISTASVPVFSDKHDENLFAAPKLEK